MDKKIKDNVGTLERRARIYGKAKISMNNGRIRHIEIENIETVPESKIPNKSNGIKCKDLLKSDLVGIWKNRTDISDTLDFVNKIRSNIVSRN